MAAPLTPRPRGTIYEALPLFFNVFEKAADGCISNRSDAIITVQQESELARPEPNASGHWRLNDNDCGTATFGNGPDSN